MPAMEMMCLLAIGSGGNRTEGGFRQRRHKTDSIQIARAERKQRVGRQNPGVGKKPCSSVAAAPLSLGMPFEGPFWIDYQLGDFLRQRVTLRIAQLGQGAATAGASGPLLARTRVQVARGITNRPLAYIRRNSALESKEKRFEQWPEYFAWVKRSTNSRASHIASWTEYREGQPGIEHRTDPKQRSFNVQEEIFYPLEHPFESPPRLEYRTPQYTDCGLFVSTIVRTQDPNFPAQGTDAIRNYVHNYPKGKQSTWAYGNIATSAPQPGDILWRKGHVALYDGRQGKRYLIHQASLGLHEPRKHSDEKLNFTEWFRLLNAPGPEESAAMQKRLRTAEKVRLNQRRPKRMP